MPRDRAPQDGVLHPREEHHLWFSQDSVKSRNVDHYCT